MQIIGTSPSTKRLREEVRGLSKGRKSVVIIGEEGVGKGLVAEAIHLESKDARKPYVRLNVESAGPGLNKRRARTVIESREIMPTKSE